MSLQTALTAVKDSIISGVTGFNAYNCKISDESIFDYLQTNMTLTTQCCLVDFGGMSNNGKSEFSSSMISWKVLVNGFFLILDQDDYMSALQQARDFVDNVVQLAAQNSTLNGSVLRVVVDSSSPPLSYRRGSYNYILVALSATVTENVS